MAHGDIQDQAQSFFDLAESYLSLVAPHKGSSEMERSIYKLLRNYADEARTEHFQASKAEKEKNALVIVMSAAASSFASTYPEASRDDGRGLSFA